MDTTAPYSASWAIDPDGNRALRAVATDGAGNTGADVVNVTIDRTSPTGSLTAPADAAFVTGAAVTVSSDSADAGSGVATAEFQRRPAGGGPWTTIDTDTTAPYSATWDTTSLTDGDHDLRVLTTDEAGNTFTSATRTVTVDNSAPSAPALTLSESSPFAYVSGSEIFVNTDETGSYDVDATSADAHSGIDKVRFPGPTDDSSSPYSASYGFGDLAGSQTVTAFNGAGLTASSQFTVTPDTAEPAGGSVSYPDGYDADGDVTITVDAGTDALSGVAPASAVLERRTAPLSGGTCDPFAGAWSTVTSPDTVASGQCAQYRYRVSDRVGNEAVYTSAERRQGRPRRPGRARPHAGRVEPVRARRRHRDLREHERDGLLRRPGRHLRRRLRHRQGRLPRRRRGLLAPRTRPPTTSTTSSASRP